MLVRLVVPLFAMLASACSPGVCGEVSIGDVQPNPDIEKHRRSDGRIGLIEFCGITYGASSTARVDLGLTTLVLDQNVMEDVTGGPISPIPRVVLPAAFVVFWSANLVAGKTLTLAQLAGTGLHKSSEGLTYETYRLTAATLTVLEGPLDRREEKDIDIVSWSETWRLRWSFEFGNGAQRWQGEDVVERTKDLEVGSPGQLPPDAKP